MDIRLNSTDLGIIMLCLFLGLILITVGLRIYLRIKSKRIIQNELRLPVYEEDHLPVLDIFQYRPIILSLSFIIILIANISILNWTVAFIENDAPNYKIDVTKDIELIPPITYRQDQKTAVKLAEDVHIEETIEEIFEDEITTELTKKSHEKVVEIKEISDRQSIPEQLPLPQIEEETKEYFDIVEQRPRFPGCEDRTAEEQRDVHSPLAIVPPIPVMLCQ